MKIDKFYREAGLKVLSIAHLEKCEYSIVLYLLNCGQSGLDEIVTTDMEFASLIGYEEQELHQALVSLNTKQIIKVIRSIQKTATNENPSLRIAMEYNVRKWIIETVKKVEISAKDALVFPFRRRGGANLTLLGSEQKTAAQRDQDHLDWRKILDLHLRERSYDDHEIEHEEEAAKVLLETHPLDQVLLLLKHFGERISSLSLLASLWQHYQEIYESEVQNIDLIGARKKHFELDQELRGKAEALLSGENTKNLSAEEITVLNILLKHRHPRRQLYWAFRVKDRYPNLTVFFNETSELMLPVTSSGQVIKRPHHDI